jgi:hypothetical protein
MSLHADIIVVRGRTSATLGRGQAGMTEFEEAAREADATYLEVALDEYLTERPQAIWLDTTGLDENAAYERLLNALAAT